MDKKIAKQVGRGVLETLSQVTVGLQELELQLQLTKEAYVCVASRWGGDKIETVLMKFYDLIHKTARIARTLTMEVLRTLTNNELQRLEAKNTNSGD